VKEEETDPRAAGDAVGRVAPFHSSTGRVVADIVKRPFITVGFAAFVLLVPLALTSTQAAIRRLGRRWQTLHRLIYVSAGLAILHAAHVWDGVVDADDEAAEGGGPWTCLGASCPMPGRSLPIGRAS
jgi:hypothetical protein